MPLVRPRQLRPGAGDAEGEGPAQPRHSRGGKEYYTVIHRKIINQAYWEIRNVI